MLSSFKQTVPNNNHSVKHDHHQSSMEIKIDLEEKMSLLTNNDNINVNYQEAEEEDDDDDVDETSRLVSIKIENDQEQREHLHYEQGTSGTTLRSILRKRTERKMSPDGLTNVQQTSITIDANVNDDDDERDSDYTGDENEEDEAEESNGNSKSVEEESENNEQRRHRCRNYSRHQRRDNFVRTSPSTSLDFPSLESARTETRVIRTGTTTPPTATTLNGNDHSSNRAACVTFTKDQPIIIHRSSSTPQLSGLELQPRSSVTYIDMRENLSTSIPITKAAGLSAPLSAEFRPVYVSPLKYRPLVGLSANDNRLLLEKRVSLLGKPLVFHPIQKRSPAYRRIQLRIYNFLERPHGCKAIFYHTFV